MQTIFETIDELQIHSREPSFFFDVMRGVPFLEFVRLAFRRGDILNPIVESPLYQVLKKPGHLPENDFHVKNGEDYLAQCKKRGILPFSVLNVGLSDTLNAGSLEIRNPHEYSYLCEAMTPFLFRGGAPHYLLLNYFGEDRESHYPCTMQMTEAWNRLRDKTERINYILHDGRVHIYGPWTSGGREENTDVWLEQDKDGMKFTYMQGRNLNGEQRQQLSAWISTIIDRHPTFSLEGSW